jgi:hypothetical protein
MIKPGRERKPLQDQFSRKYVSWLAKFRFRSVVIITPICFETSKPSRLRASSLFRFRNRWTPAHRLARWCLPSWAPSQSWSARSSSSASRQAFEMRGRKDDGSEDLAYPLTLARLPLCEATAFPGRESRSAWVLAKGPFIRQRWNPPRTIPEAQTRPAYNQQPTDHSNGLKLRTLSTTPKK